MRILDLRQNFDKRIVQDLLLAYYGDRHWIDDIFNQGNCAKNQLKTILVSVDDDTKTDVKLSDALVVEYVPNGNYGFLKVLRLKNEAIVEQGSYDVQLIKEAISLLNKFAYRNGHQNCYEIFSMVSRKPTKSSSVSTWAQQCKCLYAAGFRLVEAKTSVCGIPLETLSFVLIYKPHLLPNFQVENGVRADYIKRSVVSSVFNYLGRAIEFCEDGKMQAKELHAFARFLLESPNMPLLNIRPSFPWSDKQGPSPETQVAVVGGGMAGLSAAALLSKAGFDVVLLEAANYLGGRVKQVQPFEGFAPIDLGGEFIHGSNTVINRIAMENNWLVQPDYNEGDKEGTIYYKGKLYLESSEEPDIQSAREAWSQTIGVGFQHQPHSFPSENSSSSPESDLLKVRLQQQGFSEDALKVVDGWKVKISAGSLEHYGVKEGGRRMESKREWGHRNFRLAASYSQLVDYYLSKCEDVDKRVEWQVKDVIWKGEKSSESNPSGGVLIRNHLGEVLAAKYVVITVPLTILKDGDISFVPDLPSNKKRAIDTIKMRGASKIVCRFKTHFWPESIDQIYTIGGLVNEIWFYTSDSRVSEDRCHLVAGFATAETAEEKVDLSGQDVLDGFVKYLDEIFGTETNPRPATESLVDYVYYHWSKHPFVRGGYSSPTAHAYDLRQELARPLEDRVFFAGEATSLRSCATVPTAIETGIRVAEEVCRASGVSPVVKL